MNDISLRLWGAQHAATAIGKSVLLDHQIASGRRVVLVVDSKGIAAIVCEAEAMPPSEAGLVRGSDEPWPALQLVRVGGQPRWFSWPLNAEKPTPLSAEGVRAASRGPRLLTSGGRRAIVGAIHGYYVQHVLEPSVAVCASEPCSPSSFEVDVNGTVLGAKSWGFDLRSNGNEVATVR